MDKIYIITIVISVIGIGIITIEKKDKKPLSYFGSVLAVVGIIFGSLEKCSDQKNSEKRYAEQKTENESQKVTIKTLSDSVFSVNNLLRIEAHNTDSLKYTSLTLTKQNKMLHNDITEVKKQEGKHFVQNQQSLNDVTRRTGQRFFNQITEEQLTDKLRESKGSIMIEISSQTDETETFSNQLRRIFKNAGWQVSSMQTLGGIVMDRDQIKIRESTMSKFSQCIGNLAFCYAAQGYKFGYYPFKPSSNIEDFDVVIEVYSFSGTTAN